MPYKPPRPFELGSDEHVYELNKSKDAKWRGAFQVGICLRRTHCGGFPRKCAACFKFSQWKDKSHV